MNDGTTNGTQHQAKPEKPSEDFPLFPHASGVWAKKINGRMCYFGPWRDPDAALEKYNREREDLGRGRRPRVADGEYTTVKKACNHFLHAKAKLRDCGELSPRTWSDYEHTAVLLIGAFGSHRDVSDLGASDFVALRAKLAVNLGPVSISNEIQRIRTLFKYAYDAHLIDRPVRFGPSFKRPSKKTLRVARAQAGPRMFQAGEIRQLLDLAGVHMKAIILLAVNCGYGNNDCGRLPLTAVDLDTGWINFARPKTGIDRRCPLWPETIAALRESLANRPEPKPVAEGLFFVTKRRLAWAKETADSPITKEMAKLLTEAGIRKKGLNFYGLRHTFRTIADAAGDQPAADLVMGHARNDMASVYREMIDDKRLESVARHVRQWLFPKRKTSRGKRTAQS